METMMGIFLWVFLASLTYVTSQAVDSCDARDGSFDICADRNRFGCECREVHQGGWFEHVSSCCEHCDCPTVIFDCPIRICLVLDGSDSVTKKRFARFTLAVREWLFVTHVTPVLIRWAIVTFSTVVDDMIDFTPFQAAEDLRKSRITNLTRGGGKTFTDLGIIECQNKILGNRELTGSTDDTDLIIVITDGNSNSVSADVPNSATRDAIEDARDNNGIDVFVVTTGTDNGYDDRNEFINIVGEEWHAAVNNIDEFRDEATQLIKKIRPCEYCGDGIRNQLDKNLEECDDGDNDPNNGCDNDCQPSRTCGNGQVESPEMCDDGNTIHLDGCDNHCCLDDPLPCENTPPPNPSPCSDQCPQRVVRQPLKDGRCVWSVECEEPMQKCDNPFIPIDKDWQWCFTRWEKINGIKRGVCCDCTRMNTWQMRKIKKLQDQLGFAHGAMVVTTFTVANMTANPMCDGVPRSLKRDKNFHRFDAPDQDLLYPKPKMTISTLGQVSIFADTILDDAISEFKCAFRNGPATTTPSIKVFDKKAATWRGMNVSGIYNFDVVTTYRTRDGCLSDVAISCCWSAFIERNVVDVTPP